MSAEVNRVLQVFLYTRMGKVLYLQQPDEFWTVPRQEMLESRQWHQPGAMVLTIWQILKSELGLTSEQIELLPRLTPDWLGQDTGGEFERSVSVKNQGICLLDEDQLGLITLDPDRYLKYSWFSLIRQPENVGAFVASPAKRLKESIVKYPRRLRLRH